MTEAQITSELKTHLEKNLSGVWIKHADRSTIGIPDCSFTSLGETLWMELKLISLRPLDQIVSAKQIVESSSHGKIQLQTMRRLEFHGRAMYVVFCLRRRTYWTLLIGPEELYNAYINPQHAGFLLGESLVGRKYGDVENLIRSVRGK